MNGIKIKKETRGAKETTHCHDVYKSDGYQLGHFLLSNNKSKERPILPKVTSTGYMIPRNVPTPSKSLIVLRILMGILFIVLITRFTHIYFSYVIPNLKQVILELYLELYVRPVQGDQIISNRIPSISLTNTSSL